MPILSSSILKKKQIIDTFKNTFEPDFCAYKGLVATKMPETVIKSGEVVYHNSRLLSSKIKGHFLSSVK